MTKYLPCNPKTLEAAAAELQKQAVAKLQKQAAEASPVKKRKRCKKKSYESSNFSFFQVQYLPPEVERPYGASFLCSSLKKETFKLVSFPSCKHHHR